MKQQRKQLPDEAKQEHTGDSGFDRWLSRELHKMYDEVLDEEIPEALLDLLNEHSENSERDPTTPERPESPGKSVPAKKPT